TPARARLPAQHLDVQSGREMAKHKRLPQRLATQIFVTDPYSASERATNEHTSGLTSTCRRARTCRGTGRGS
ncbi:MAG: hypothetical protein ABI604_10855, partial [Nitrospirota bacterium]